MHQHLFTDIRSQTTCPRQQVLNRRTKTNDEFSVERTLRWKMHKAQLADRIFTRVRVSRSERKKELDRSMEVASRIDKTVVLLAKKRRAKEREERPGKAGRALLPTDSRTKRRTFATRSRCTPSSSIHYHPLQCMRVYVCARAVAFLITLFHG